MKSGQRIEGDSSGSFTTKAFSPPVLQSEFDGGTIPPLANSDALTPKDLTNFAKRARLEFLGCSNTMPTLTASELLAALAEACDRLAAEPGSTKAGDPAERLAMHSGLQLVGVRITAEQSSTDLLTNSPPHLRLINVRLPFSLRLIGCVIEPPLALSNTSIVTLELSGSALRGLDATFLKASGSVRLRNIFLVGPADFSGASIHGYFDASDAVIKPLATPPDGLRIDGDRGMLSLNQAHVDNDVRLARATVWGGLSMRSLKTQRSLYLDEAVVLSPLGALEALTLHALGLAGKRKPQLQPLQQIMSDMITPWPRQPDGYCKMVREQLSADLDCGNAEFLKLRSAHWQGSVLGQLLTYSLRARTSALRADGLEASGSVFAHHISCHGRLRMKYAVVTGGLSLQGASLRSAEAMRRAFDDIPLEQGGAVDMISRANKPGATQPTVTVLADLMKNRPKNLRVAHLVDVRELSALRLLSYAQVISTKEFADDIAPPYADAYVLDLRESRFGGSVRIGIPPDDADKRASTATAHAPTSKTTADASTSNDRSPRGFETQIDGVLALRRADIDGELFLDGIQFTWSFRVQHTPPDDKIADAAYQQLDYLARKERCRDVHDQQIIQGKRHIIAARNITVTDTVSLTGCVNLKGADFRNATITGDFLMLQSVVPDSDGYRAVRPCHNPGGRINLEGATISGDCQLMFDGGLRDGEQHSITRGPAIEASLASIGGELLIAGPPGPNDSVTHDSTIVGIADTWVADDWLATEMAAAKGELQDWQAKRRKHPKIDLRNAQAALFTHMPAAWPRMGRLNVVGFRYTRQGSFGPLAPFAVVGAAKSRRTFKDRLRIGGGAVMVAATVAEVVAMCLRPDLVTDWGLANLGALLGVMLLLALYWLLPRISRPFPRDSRPMALTWLRLQQLAANDSRSQTGWPAAARGWLPYRRNGSFDVARRPRGTIFQSLEPFAIAAKALREEGRWISANRVEQRRLEVRTSQLSWRQHLFEKTGFVLISILAHYGFSYVRAFFFTAFLTVGIAIEANHADQHGFMQHKLAKVEVHPQTGPTAAQLSYATTIRHRGAVDLALTVGPDAPAGDAAACSKAGGRCKDFDSLLFALDTVLPAVSTGTDEEWEADSRVYLMPWLTLRGLFNLGRYLGLAFFGLLLLGISARVGLLLGRYNE